VTGHFFPFFHSEKDASAPSLLAPSGSQPSSTPGQPGDLSPPSGSHLLDLWTFNNVDRGYAPNLAGFAVHSQYSTQCMFLDAQVWSTWGLVDVEAIHKGMRTRSQSPSLFVPNSFRIQGQRPQLCGASTYWAGATLCRPPCIREHVFKSKVCTNPSDNNTSPEACTFCKRPSGLQECSASLYPGF